MSSSAFGHLISQNGYQLFLTEYRFLHLLSTSNKKRIIFKHGWILLSLNYQFCFPDSILTVSSSNRCLICFHCRPLYFCQLKKVLAFTPLIGLLDCSLSFTFFCHKHNDVASDVPVDGDHLYPATYYNHKVDPAAAAFLCCLCAVEVLVYFNFDFKLKLNF